MIGKGEKKREGGIDRWRGMNKGGDVEKRR